MPVEKDAAIEKQNATIIAALAINPVVVTDYTQDDQTYTMDRRIRHAAKVMHNNIESIVPLYPGVAFSLTPLVMGLDGRVHRNPFQLGGVIRGDLHPALKDALTEYSKSRQELNSNTGVITEIISF